jgi:hypothetical protein
VRTFRGADSSGNSAAADSFLEHDLSKDAFQLS